MGTNRPETTRKRSVVVVGAGGNIGSHLVPHLARMPLESVTLIDKDVYEASNLQSQDITPQEVGKRKTAVQARRLKRINPAIQVNAIHDSVERVPLGKLRATVILACLDSRVARQHVNQFAWRLGVPLIDAGVEAGGMLARINVYVPGVENPCLECPWDDRDYQALEQLYPCFEFASGIPATNAPSSLGALAASLQAIECLKLLNGQSDLVAVGKQIVLDATHHKHYVTAFRRNPNCRFSGHEVWDIRSLESSVEDLTLAEALCLSHQGSGVNGSDTLRIEGKSFVTRLTCPGCGKTRSLLRLGCSLRRSHTRCAECGRAMITPGFDALERLSADVVPRSALSRSLRSLGLRRGEVFSVSGDQGESHFEIG